MSPVTSYMPMDASFKDFAPMEEKKKRKFFQRKEGGTKFGNFLRKAGNFASQHLTGGAVNFDNFNRIENSKERKEENTQKFGEVLQGGLNGAAERIAYQNIAKYGTPTPYGNQKPSIADKAKRSIVLKWVSIGLALVGVVVGVVALVFKGKTKKR